MEAHSDVPVTKSQVLALARLDEHHFGTEEQLLHDGYEQPGVHLWVSEAPGQPAAVLNQLVTTGDAVSVQVQDGDAQGGAGGLTRAGKGDKDSEFRDQSTVHIQRYGGITMPSSKGRKPLQEEAGHPLANQQSIQPHFRCSKFPCPKFPCRSAGC